MSRFWAAFFPRFYGLLRFIEAPIRRWTMRFGLGDTVQLTVVGRNSGRPRSVLLGLLRLRGDWYVGHPNGSCGWTRNLDAAGDAVVVAAGLGPVRVRAISLPVGEERSDAIEATFRQHPFPGNLMYWLARRHVRAVGRYYRLEVIAPDDRREPGPEAARPRLSGGGSARGAR